jgi:hypothetical protein
MPDIPPAEKKHIRRKRKLRQKVKKPLGNLLSRKLAKTHNQSGEAGLVRPVFQRVK